MKAGRVAGRATHLYRDAKNLWEKRMVSEGGKFSKLKVLNALRIYFAPPEAINREIFPDEESRKGLLHGLEHDIWMFIIGSLRDGDHKSLRLFADAVEHFSTKGVMELDPIGKNILKAYHFVRIKTKGPPTKRQLYDYFFDNFDYKKMHFEEFCHRADKLSLRFKKTAKRTRKRTS